MNDLDVTTALRQAGMLADVSISTWGGTRTDNGLLNEVKRQHNAHGDVGRMMKNLLAGHDARLKAARGAYNAVRQRYYELTLPWTSDPHALRQTGPRLLTFPLFDNFMKEMAAAKRVAFDARDEFVEHYEEDAEAARGNLGGLVLETEYPSRDDVEAAFRIHFDIEPIPESSTFRGLPDLALNSLKKNLDKKRESQIKAAQSAAWSEARERVEHLIKRIADPDAKFKSSTVSNVRELLELLPGWKLTTESHQVDEIVADIESMLQGVDPDSLRRDAKLRKATASSAQSVINKMNVWGL
jgi:hypothetical protein